LIIHIHGGELQDLAHPHAPTSHEFQDESISRLGCPEDDLVNGFLFRDLPLPAKFLEVSQEAVD
jgi:hypothetical protein